MTSKDPIVVRSIATDDDLNPHPIDPTWIVEGAPETRARILAFGEHRMLSGMLWESTTARFDWHYGSDEVIQVLAGEAELTMSDGSIQVIRQGDIVFFPGHQIIRWYIPVYLKKLALNTPEISIPRQMAHRVPFARRIVRKAKAMRGHAVAVVMASVGVLGHLGDVVLSA